MRYAQIVAGRVHGVFEYDPLPEFAPEIVMIELPEGFPAQPGWRYEGGEFIAPEPLSDPVPPSVSMRQARHAMLQAGILGAVQTMIEQMPGDEGDAARIDWGFAQEVRRDHPMVSQLAATLGLAPTEVDDLFIAAAGIP